MRFLFTILAVMAASTQVFPQTCTITGASQINWVNPGPSCSEGGNAGSKSILVIPAGVTLDFDGVSDTWTGTRIDVYGTLKVSADVTINASIVVYNGGFVDLGAKLSLGTSPSNPTGCNYSFVVKTGGSADTGNASDRLYVCGSYIIKGGGGGCNNCGSTNSATCAFNSSTPYCAPSTITGPIGWTKDGFNGILPIKLRYFNGFLNSEKITLSWATSMQENFDQFIIQRSVNGVDFNSIGVVKGEGQNIYDIESKYAFDDEHPLIGVNYYRLMAVDLDKTFEYFNVIAMPFAGNKKVWIEPNPTDGNSIQLKCNFLPGVDDRISILTYLGVGVNDFVFLKDKVKIEFSSALTPGLYIIKYATDGIELTTRALVH